MHAKFCQNGKIALLIYFCLFELSETIEKTGSLIVPLFAVSDVVAGTTILLLLSNGSLTHIVVVNWSMSPGPMTKFDSYFRA